MVNAGDDVRVMIIDDHEVVRRGIAEVVERADGLGVVAEAGSVQEAIRRGELVRPDVALVDLRLPDGTGIDIISRMREASPETKCIVLTSFDDDDALGIVCILIEADVIKLLGTLHAIDVEMRKAHLPFIYVHQVERRTRDLARKTQTTRQSLHEERLSRAEIAREREDRSRRAKRPDALGERRRLLGGSRFHRKHCCNTFP